MTDLQSFLLFAAFIMLLPVIGLAVLAWVLK